MMRIAVTTMICSVLTLPVFAQEESPSPKTLSATVSTGGDASGISEATCRNGELVRKVSIEVDDPATKAPCRVVYDKEVESPGQKQTLWTAEADGKFCVSKATEFVGKLEGWGWECERKAM